MKPFNPLDHISPDEHDPGVIGLAVDRHQGGEVPIHDHVFDGASSFEILDMLLDYHIETVLHSPKHKGFVRAAPEPDRPFKWLTAKGRIFLPKDMATEHLFYSLRMIFNHSVPACFRVGTNLKRYGDVPYWTAEYRARAIVEFNKELNKRTDLPLHMKNELADIRSNTAVVIAIGI